jgi:Flp pilus assembly protein TadG
MLASVNGLMVFLKGRVTSFCESSSIFTPSGGKWRWKNGLAMRTRMKTIAAVARGFLRAKRGNVAMMFGLALVPLVLAAGAGLDYSRAMLVRQQMGEALDAAALAVGSTTGLNATTAQALAQKYFDANYTVDKTSFGSPTIQPLTYNANGSVSITANNSMNTILMNLVGIPNIPISTTSTVVWGQSKLWVALVLDNSGSMSQGDASGSKMSALKNASQQLLTTMQNASATAGDVQVSIVPFVKVVNVGTANVGASWIDWSDWSKPPVTDQVHDTHQADSDSELNGWPLKSFGPGDSCPYSNSMGYLCNANATNNSNCSPDNSGGCINIIASSGATKGFICPSMHGSGTSDGLPYHFYNGCWTGTTWDNSYSQQTGSSATCNGHSASNCTCTGSSGSKVCSAKNYPHTWVANRTGTWDGCIMDREWKPAASTDYDETNTTPSSGYTNFPAENNQYCAVATVTPLGYNWTTLSNQITAMTAYGATNQAVGFEHGWQTLTPGLPYGTPSVPANTSRYIIILSDGLNTEDRWWGNGSTESTTQDGNIDTRMNAVCTAAKADGIIVYSIYVNIGGTDGNSAPLQNCASDSSKYFALTTTNGVVTAFAQIAEQITNVRVVH